MHHDASIAFAFASRLSSHRRTLVLGRCFPPPPPWVTGQLSSLCTNEPRLRRCSGAKLSPKKIFPQKRVPDKWKAVHNQSCKLRRYTLTSWADAAPGPEPQLVDAPMLPALPLPPDFHDTTVSSAMCLWAEEVEISVDIARQAVSHVHANFAAELSQHPSADHICLPKPMHLLMVRAIGAVCDAPAGRTVRQLRSSSSQHSCR